MEEESPLDRLVQDETLDEEMLADALEPYVRLSSDDSDILLKSSVDDLTAQAKVVVYLLALKAREAIGMKERADADPSEISDKMNINSNTTRTALHRLKEAGVVRKVGGAPGYRVPNSRVSLAVEKIKEKQKDFFA